MLHAADADIADADIAAPHRTLHVQRGSLEVNRLERRTLDGRLYAVAPAVAVREGVLNGQLLLADEIANSVLGWNGRPVPLRHPRVDGKNVSANSPQIVEQYVLGHVYNAHMAGDKLHVEVWLDVEKCNRVGGDALAVLEALDNGVPMDVSTGYFCQVEEAQGIFNGQVYTGVQHNILPDHVALLPNEEGACSWRDGCGVPRVNTVHKEEAMQDEDMLAGDAQDVGADVAFAQREAPAHQEAETATPTVNAEPEDDAQDTVDDTEAVVEPTASAAPSAEDEPEDDTEPTVQASALEDQWAELGALITEAGGMDRFRSTLMQAFDVAMLVSELGGIDAVRGLLSTLQANRNAARDDVLARLAANSACAFSADDLATMSTEALEKLDRSLRPANYGVRANARANPTEMEWRVLPPPSTVPQAANA